MKPYYYVYRRGNQSLSVKHATLAEAQKKAERLAQKYKGESFEILKCVGITMRTKTDTFWMDGECPLSTIESAKKEASK